MFLTWAHTWSAPIQDCGGTTTDDTISLQHSCWNTTPPAINAAPAHCGVKKVCACLSVNHHLSSLSTCTETPRQRTERLWWFKRCVSVSKTYLRPTQTRDLNLTSIWAWAVSWLMLTDCTAWRGHTGGAHGLHTICSSTDVTDADLTA